MTHLMLGPFRLDTRKDLLLRGTEPAVLGKRAIALLRALVERPGELVSKEALIDAAWPGQAVEESNLTVQIAALRRVLAEAPGGNGWIETMHRRGYRFIGPIVTEPSKDDLTAPPQADAVPNPKLAPADAERRQITAMSCELVGVATGADGLEDLREAITDFRHCVAEIVDRHNGFVVSRLGNTQLVLFGYPAAHEHDAEHAVRAGLELCAAVRIPTPGARGSMRCRVGIATGASIIGDPSRSSALQDREIVGNVPNLAARLQLSVQPGIVAIESDTRQLIGNLFDCRDLGAVETAGSTEPTRIWQVLGANNLASRFEALRGSAPSPLIGRDEEIDLLLRRWERAKTGEGQIVLVSGEAGIGKSRLAAAFEERLQSEPHLRLRYFCSPHHQDSALFPVIDQLGRAANFSAEDSPEARRDKLETLLDLTAPPDEDVALLFDLLSLPASDRHPLPKLSPQRKKQRILEALVRQLKGLAHRQPVFAIFEDLHWIDPTSRELLDLAVEQVRGLPVLLIVTFRSEFQPSWVGQPGVTALALNRLDRRERIALASHTAGGKALPDEVLGQIAGRTDGVPLFVEELTKSVLESGLLRVETDRYALDGALPPFAIPTTLHGSLLARLDRLASVRHVAQIGATIGHEFSYGVVHAVSDLPEDALRGALAGLVASELVFQRGTPPDAVYSFKHALVQDAAHGTLLRRTRQQLHARVADALEAQSPELMETQPELFAQHYAEAGFVEKSAVWWSKAAQKAYSRSAMTEAAAQFLRALAQVALLADNPERRRLELECLKGLGATLQSTKGYGAPETGQTFDQALKLCERLSFPSEFPEIFYGQACHYTARGELDRAQSLADDLLRLSRQRNDSVGLILGHLAAGRNLLMKGTFALARSHLEKVLVSYDPISHRRLPDQNGTHPHVLAQAHLEIVLFGLGFPDQAVAQSRAAIAEARRLDHPPSLAASLGLGNILLSLVGDRVALDEQARQLIVVATEQGFPFRRAMATVSQGWIKVKNGGVEEGISLLRSGLVAYRSSGTEIWVPYRLALLAGAQEVAGQIEEALPLLDEALRMVERTGERWFEAELHRQKGQLLLRQGHAEAAEGLYRKALDVAVGQDAKLWELRAAVCLARLHREQGRHAEARDLLAPLYGWFTEGFGTPDLKEAKALLDELG
jgi:predicted ATPase/DNA-binding winged helix-turn-helix (wHTH) protein